MIHFLYLFGFAVFGGIILGAISQGDSKAKILLGIKTFAQFFFISLALAWLFYFIPW